MIFGLFSPEKIWEKNSLQTCPSQQSDVATLPWEIQKKSFFNILLIIYII